MVTISLTDPSWLRLVEAEPAATPFHHPAWAETLASAYGFEAEGLLVEPAEGPAVPVPVVRLRRRLSSLPFTDHCPLLGPETSARAILAELERLRRAEHLGAIEIRDDAEGTGHRVESGHRHELDLGAGYEAVAAGFSKSKVSRKLRRADREGIGVRFDTGSRALLEDFYPLHVGTRRRLGVPVQPRRFFAELGRRVIEPGLGFTVTAEIEGDPVCSAVFLAWNGRLVYKFSASSRDRGDVGAAQAVIREAIRWGCEHGYRSLDFGRTDAGAEGLRSFKLSWGASEHDLAYTTLADRAPRTGSGRTHELLAQVLRRSPESLTRAIGTAAYRYTA
ncbi:MAG: GNAT family N-acetyltransferase [Solirubrobacterales bacterium]